MHHQRLLSILRRIVAVPTAPFHERLVAAAIREALAELPHVSVEEDAFGNLLARYRRGRRRARMAFGAHMDHPGWVRHRGREEFLGGVPAERLDSHPVEWFGDFGMWRLEPFALEGDRIRSRACDDLVGCAAIVALFHELESRGVEASCHGVFTRAEEVGFYGAMELAKRWPFPAGVCFVSLETSAPRGGAEMGKGPVVRVGDRLSVFDDGTAAELVAAAQRAGIDFQRALLDGGSCEATAMNLHGVPAAGVSVMLENYHNCPPGGGIAEEAVSLADVKGLVRLTAEAVAGTAGGGRAAAAKKALRRRIEKRLREHRPHLRAAARAARDGDGGTPSR